ncbi:hypothetical protein [Bradyrhizobium sp. AUGA SZCCT0042]|uniref:hypothetical protein n=1 Tax=Bradyrhizobium sp. AUGA SZCCT0042 TaxID=2807651 RepID=UPI001BA67428|nr:hypothetical protein [Bradyrhizobium sp. AUGA SZCCT0042]MBR1302171.1 hypothetical protein [Bradyrhizobium sp. AUGA SZCCT0042]
MELGTAIFLSSIAVAIVLLYGFTKDRWPWRRIVLRSLAAVLALVVVGTAVIIVAQYWDQMFPVKLDRQTQYDGLRLGMSKDEVKYIKGIPTTVITNDKDGPWKDFGVVQTSELPKGKTVNDYSLWSYDGHKRYYNVGFGNSSTVVSIGCYSEDKSYRCPAIGDVRDGTSEAEMLRKLGPPTKSAISGVTKSVEYNNIGVEFKLQQETIYYVLVGETPTR